MDKIKQEFLKQMRCFANELYEISSWKIRQQFEKELTEIVDSFRQAIYPLFEKYNDLKEQGVVGELAWIYISYLRSGVICDIECFRIDCYDLRNRISGIECAEKWRFSFLWSLYEENCKEIKEKFDKQTKAKMYEFDYIKMDLAESYYRLSIEIFPRILTCLLETGANKPLNGNKVTFMAGEFLDKSEFILQWNKDNISWNQEDFKPEEQKEIAR